MVEIKWLTPSNAKNSHCSGTNTAWDATNAFKVSKVKEGGQSIRT